MHLKRSWGRCLKQCRFRQTEYAKTEALEALTALGYSASDALKAVRKAGVTEDMDTETILKLALKADIVL